MHSELRSFWHSCVTIVTENVSPSSGFNRPNHPRLPNKTQNVQFTWESFFTPFFTPYIFLRNKSRTASFFTRCCYKKTIVVRSGRNVAFATMDKKINIFFYRFSRKNCFFLTKCWELASKFYALS